MYIYSFIYIYIYIHTHTYDEVYEHLQRQLRVVLERDRTCAELAQQALCPSAH